MKTHWRMRMFFKGTMQSNRKMESPMNKTFMRRNGLGLPTCLALSFTTAVTFAGDVERGRHIAQDRCASRHIVGRGLRSIVADSPPIEIMGRRYGFAVRDRDAEATLAR
jgi:hypothetical protein